MTDTVCRWMQEQQRCLALPSIEQQAIETSSSGVQTWTYVPKNSLMYVPEGMFIFVSLFT